jgi:hypothetical protein
MSPITNLLSQRATTVGLIALVVMIIAGGKNINVDARLQKEKVVKKLTYRNEPLELLEIKLSEKPIKLEEKAVAEGDWLKKLSLKLKNSSAKTIVFAEIALDFPETETARGVMSYRLRLGNNPASQNNFRAPLRLGPRETVTVSVEGEYEKLKQFLGDAHPVTAINDATVGLVFVAFDDGTGWSEGETVKPDPNNPRRYVNIKNP